MSRGTRVRLGARLAALSLAVMVLAPAVAAGASPYRPGTVTTTTLARAQALAPFVVRHPTKVADGGRLISVQVVFPPVRNDPHRIQVNITYGRARHFVLLEETWGHANIAGVKAQTRIDGVPAAVRAFKRKGYATLYTVALYFPDESCLFTAPGTGVSMSALKAMAASLTPR